MGNVQASSWLESISRDVFLRCIPETVDEWCLYIGSRVFASRHLSVYVRVALGYKTDGGGQKTQFEAPMIMHATASESAKSEASLNFQQIGFENAVLSDEKRRRQYDLTGKTDEGFDLAPGEDWEAHLVQMFDRITRGTLDEMKKEYQRSSEEVDETRFPIILSDLIYKGELTSLTKWQSSIKDEKAKLVRQKQSEKEAKEAEKLARELGVWDEFYGSGKRKGKRKGKGKSKGKDDAEEEGGRCVCTASSHVEEEAEGHQ
ncbi:hypothetical protein EV368DRAFT_66390 [Lentinula lateritia]|nr:hypothetical protein EV368DRAFT_66390 [Lentinula lateritia]